MSHVPTAPGQLADGLAVRESARRAAPSPVTTKRRLAPAARRSRARRARNAAPGTSVRAAKRPQATGEPAGAAGHRLAAGVARARSRPARPGAASSRFDHRLVGPLLRAEHPRRVLPGRPHVAQRPRARDPTPACSSASSAPAPPSVVALPPTVTSTVVRARRHRGRDQLPGAAGRSPPTRRARARRPARAHSPAPSRPPRGRRAAARSAPRPAARAGRSPSPCGTRRRGAPTSASSVPSPPSATGSSTASTPAVAQPVGDRGRHLGRAEGALERVGRDECRWGAHGT